MKPGSILILGGTGFVGRACCEALSERSASTRIRVPTRRDRHADAVRSLPCVDVVVADLHDDATLARLVAGAGAVINLVAILHGSRQAYARVHVELPRRLAAACRAAGVRRLVHVSAIGVGADAPSHYLRSKTEGEAVLQAAGLDLTLLRPSVIFGADDRFLNLFAQLQALAPLLPLAGGDARFQPVWVEDVAAAIVRCIADDTTIGRTYECVGPAEYTLAQLVALAGRWSGHERPQLPLPLALGKLQALALECLPGTPLLSRDNLDSMRVPNVGSGTLPGLADLGIGATALEAVAPRYLAALDDCTRFDRWRARAGGA
ncbi:MAG: complex I NDUFA9 subunit family protein [Burkholderiales bacterium]|nr:complex I NDUFA9 subunit family protein [Burkholderiales bacterium]MDE1929347.1 complex I NDUFA9 subunit family protein [Burkholderiales bacterium]MDE2161195.1 complex I NDUFA9 subunit family protein [Burkholderiales bacterium]MDE2505469.1 complex I NDUFA9 subunit family protein [Burkholderiales bacterium]